MFNKFSQYLIIVLITLKKSQADTFVTKMYQISSDVSLTFDKFDSIAKLARSSLEHVTCDKLHPIQKVCSKVH